MMDMNAYFSQLVGGRITGFRMVPDDYGDEPWPAFTIVAVNGDVLDVQVSRDPEGNGAGFLFIGEGNTQ